MNYTAEYQLKQDGVGKSLLFIEETLKAFKVKQRDLLEELAKTLKPANFPERHKLDAQLKTFYAHKEKLEKKS